ncbi:MAG: DUF4445 domain-containing protein [Armatimonadetes bacterium]|nr:DUF4445 domain-containing protein [Armatimonadota bacterium]
MNGPVERMGTQVDAQGRRQQAPSLGSTAPLPNHPTSQPANQPTSQPRCRVVFLPSGKGVSVEAGTILHEAAEAAGVHITGVCGGGGTCGTCRAIVRQGRVEAGPTHLLSAEEREQGYVLACQARVLGDLVIEVPLESRWESRALAEGAEAIRFGKVVPQSPGARPYRDDPLSRKVYLELPEPSLADNLPDWERLERGLRGAEAEWCAGVGVWEHGSEEAQAASEAIAPAQPQTPQLPCALTVDLPVLKKLPEVLREGNWRVTATLGSDHSALRTPHSALLDVEPGDTTARHYGLAVDVGTTTVVAHLVDLNTGKTLGVQARYNGQVRYGEDVISRIFYACEEEEGARRLQVNVVRDINRLIGELEKECGVSRAEISSVVCAGNTTMIHLLLGLEVAHIKREPYIPSANQPPVIRAADIGIEAHPRALLTCIPGVAAYVGGDITAGVLASGMHQRPELSLLFDIGTNGEVVLGGSDWLMCCSASAGPSFEGGEMKCGMRAGPGAIERLAINREGQPVYRVIGGGRPRGICGSGLIDAVAELTRSKCVDKAGQFQPERANCRLRQNEHEWEYVLAPAGESDTGRDVVITQCDIQVFLRSKGAVFTAADCLLAHLGLSFDMIDRVYVAGGFGSYLDLRNAITIGLMPDLPPEKFQFIGNSSAAGAKMCLLSREALAETQQLARKMTYIELSTDPKFMNDFISSLFLPHTDLSKFPSVAGWTRQ